MGQYGMLSQGIGGLGALLGQQQQNATAWTANSADMQQYVVSYAPVEPVAAKSPHEETAVEWLDRRVAEVCLAL